MPWKDMVVVAGARNHLNLGVRLGGGVMRLGSPSPNAKPATNRRRTGQSVPPPADDSAASWNHLTGWLRPVERLGSAASFESSAARARAGPPSAHARAALPCSVASARVVRPRRASPRCGNRAGGSDWVTRRIPRVTPRRPRIRSRRDACGAVRLARLLVQAAPGPGCCAAWQPERTPPCRTPPC